MKKKAMAFVLALCMVFAMATTAFAADASVMSVNGSTSVSGSYHHTAADSKYVTVDGFRATFTLTVNGSPTSYYKLYITAPTGTEYVSDPVLGDGNHSVSYRVPFTAGVGDYKVTVMMSSGPTYGQTNYWTVNVSW